MLYLVHMRVHLPGDMPAEEAQALKDRERTYAQRLQRERLWLHLWRVVGKYANYSVFDVESNDELHRLLSELPLYPFMTIEVTPLARHPSAIELA
jgi:muconolactone D-isomerase